MLLAGLMIAVAVAQEHEAPELLPRLIESVEDVYLDWEREEEWHHSPVRSWWDGGDRVGVLLTADIHSDIEIEVRAVDEAGMVGAWLPAEETWRGGDSQRVLVAYLDDWSPAIQLRVRDLDGRDLDGMDAIGFALHLPASEDIGEPAPPRPPSVSAALSAIGVVPREEWGASSTTCTTTEDNWYRFAIHHTAGSQTSGGTVQGAVQALQAYSMGTGTYCDIPYQFLVGYDGSLWEGRALDYYSGATGGGNNDGNMAICFLGCYDSGGCGDGGDDDTLQMIAAARLLAQTLAVQEGTSTTEDSLRGHQDWPGNHTACPGDRVVPRLDELRSEGAHYEGSLVDISFGGTVTLEQGERLEGQVRLRNNGIETWTSNTRLATLPRDQGSPLADSSWLSNHRVSVPEQNTASGQTATFPITLYGDEIGTYTMSLALVEEGVTWFSDIPIGGGPDDGTITFTVDVVAAGGGGNGSGNGGGNGGGGNGGNGGGEDSGGLDGVPMPPPGELMSLTELRGCGCQATPGPIGLLMAVLAGVVSVWRRQD